MRQFLPHVFAIALAAAASPALGQQTNGHGEGLLKVCKIGGPGIPTGTPFVFTAGSSTITVPSGPAPGGTCVIAGKFAVGTHLAVIETMPVGYTVSNIDVAPSNRQNGAANLAGGSVNVTIGTGVTEVTFTDKRTGFLEICKFGDVKGNFNFTVNPGNLGPFSVPAGACSPAIEVAAGSVIIHELPSAGSTMSGCSTIPAAQQGACNTTAQTSTVTVDPGDISTMTIATITNKPVSDAADISLDKMFKPGPEPGRGTFILTVKNPGGPLPAGAVITVSDPVPTGVILTGFGGTSGTSWSCMPGFQVTGPNTLKCTYTGTGPIAAGAVLPDLALNATLAAIGSETGIYGNCATAALATAAGSVTESNVANNRACTVTQTINNAGCDKVKCPPPVADCKQDVLIVEDASPSIFPGLPTVKGAIAKFLQPMQNKGRVNIFSFNNQPNWTPITAGWTPVTNLNWNTLANPIVLGGTRTNWDDALERAYHVVQTGPNKPLVLFVTDGDPNTSNNASGAEVDNTGSPLTAATEAVQWINAIRAAGSPIIAIGFGPYVSAGYIDAAFTGNVSGPGNINLETSSVIKMDSVNDLPGVMATLGNQMCGTLSLSKRVTAGPTFQHLVPADTTTPVSVNDTIPFTLEITNNATLPVTGVVVQDQVPGALSPVSVGAMSSGTSAQQVPPVVGNLITWSIPTLAGRTTATLNFTGQFVKTYPVPPKGSQTVETYNNYAQVTAAVDYHATALGNMNAINGPATEVDESFAAFTEQVFQQSDPCLDEANRPIYCYLQLAKVLKNPGAEDNSCTSSATGGPIYPCPFTISVNIIPTYIPAGSTVTVADDFTVGSTAVSGWAATVPSSFCQTTPPSVSFSCPHGSLNSFSGDVTVMIPPGQTGQKKNCITVTITNTSPVFNKSANACVTF
jgi:uncharacterized repeat protein (TIGR01451 family)